MNYIRFYTGREYDKEIGLYYLRARYYHPDTGRFVSRDPIGQVDDVNVYGYVANSPLRYTDRMGKEKEVIANVFRGATEDFTKVSKMNYFDGLREWKDLNTGKYDLAHFRDRSSVVNRNNWLISKQVTQDNLILIDGEYFNLGEVSNILVGYNAYNADYSLSTLKTGGLGYTFIAEFTGKSEKSNGYTGEFSDQELYTAGYELAKSGNLSTESIVSTIRSGTRDRYESTQVVTPGELFGVAALGSITTIPNTLTSLSNNLINY